MDMLKKITQRDHQLFTDATFGSHMPILKKETVEGIFKIKFGEADIEEKALDSAGKYINGQIDWDDYTSSIVECRKAYGDKYGLYLDTIETTKLLNRKLLAIKGWDKKRFYHILFYTEGSDGYVHFRGQTANIHSRLMLNDKYFTPEDIFSGTLGAFGDESIIICNLLIQALDALDSIQSGERNLVCCYQRVRETSL